MTQTKEEEQNEIDYYERLADENHDLKLRLEESFNQGKLSQIEKCIKMIESQRNLFTNSKYTDDILSFLINQLNKQKEELKK
jgi:hypothetical protein